MTIFPSRRTDALPRVIPNVPPPADIAEYAPPTTRRTQLSEEAGRSAQVVIDLHHEVDTLKTQLETTRSHVNVLEESNTIIHEENASLRRDNERLRIENTIIHTRLRDAVLILANILKPLTEIEISSLRNAVPEPLPPESSSGSTQETTL